MWVGSLLDFYIEGATINDKWALADYTVGFFKSKQMDICECQSNDEELIAVCSAMGMIHVGGFRVLFRRSPKQPRSNEDHWYLTQGEGDVLLG